MFRLYEWHEEYEMECTQGRHDYRYGRGVLSKKRKAKIENLKTVLPLMIETIIIEKESISLTHTHTETRHKDTHNSRALATQTHTHTHTHTHTPARREDGSAKSRPTTQAGQKQLHISVISS